MTDEKSKGPNAQNQSRITVTHRDRMLKAWEDTMQHAREYKRYSHIYAETPFGNLFDDLARHQGFCAAALHEMLLREEKSSEPLQKL